MRLNGIARISVGLVAVTCTILLVLDLVGVLPQAQQEILRERTQLCEGMALQGAMALERGDFSGLSTVLVAAVRRSDIILSAGYRDESGRLMAATRGHARRWKPTSERSTVTHARVPLVSRGRSRGTIEVRFEDVPVGGLLGALWDQPLVRLLLAFGVSGFVTYLLYMRRVLRQLDPSAVIPPRVQATLDVMTEGVVLVDRHEQIVLANQAFATYAGLSSAELMGSKASELPWRVPQSADPARELPWAQALRKGETIRGVPLVLGTSPVDRFTLMVSAAPVLDGKGGSQGAIVTCDDVTELERKSQELHAAMTELEKSRDEIRLQNDELQVLASCDSLTGLANRRTFLARFDTAFAAARHDAADLCCVMVDIDHFKRVNDDHGHATGDAAICAVSSLLLDEFKDVETTCRYGGEEFCVLLWDTPMEKAAEIAERLRAQVASDGFTEVPISSSFGVSSIASGARSPQELINQADEALYFSKENGRNRVTRFDEIPRQSGS